MKLFLLSFLMAFLSGSFCFAQSRQEIDSLKHELSIAKHDTRRVLLMTDIAFNDFVSNPQSSKLYAQKALELSKKIKFSRGEAKALSIMALIIRQDGNLSESLELQLKSLKIAEENGYPLETGYSLMRIGNIYRDEIDRIKAVNFYNRAIKEYETAHFDEGIAALFMNLGTLYLSSNKIDSAVKYSQLAFERSKQVVIPLRLQSDIFVLLGNVQDRVGNTASALNYWKQGLQIAIQAEDTRTKTANYLTIAQFYNREHLYDSSIYYAEKGLMEAKRISFKRQLLLANKLLAVGYESKNLSKAHYHLKEAQLVNEELYGPKQVQALQKIVFEEQELQRKIEADAIAYQNQLRQYSFLAGLGVLLVIAFLLYRNNQQKQKANILLNIQKEKVEQTLETLKSTQSQLIQKEKLASLGELTEGIAHEIQNPLNFVNNFSELSVDLAKELNEDLDKESIDKVFVKELMGDLTQNQEKINHHSKRAASIVKGMLEHSRQSTGERELTDINQLADEYLRLAYHGFRAKDKDGSATRFNSDYELIMDKDLPKIEVVPQEIGIPDTIKSNIVQPFFTPKPTGEGTGLGLSLAYDIVAKGHIGTIECESVEGEGTMFRVGLPIKQQ